MRAVRIVVAAGGTAGHVFPGLALAHRLVERFDAEVLFVGRREGQEARLVPQAGFSLASVEALPFVRRPSLAALRAPLSALRAARRCRPLVREADVVVGMGGFVSVPLSLAAWREHRPLVLHEQNAVPGLANRMGSLWARTVAVSFEETAARLRRRAHVVVTGNPVREEILRVRDHRRELAAEAAAAFGLDPGRRTVAMFGGSQGAVHLNRAGVGACRILGGRSDLQVLLITGPAHHDGVRASLPRDGDLVVRPEPFTDRMDLVYAIADLVVARAGATTVAEVGACGLPALLIPYPYATARHQEANARALQRAGGASVLLDDELSGASLAERLGELVDHPERLEAMARASMSFGRPAAADRLAEVVSEAA